MKNNRSFEANDIKISINKGNASSMKIIDDDFMVATVYYSVIVIHFIT